MNTASITAAIHKCFPIKSGFGTTAPWKITKIPRAVLFEIAQALHWSLFEQNSRPCVISCSAHFTAVATNEPPPAGERGVAAAFSYPTRRQIKVNIQCPTFGRPSVVLNKSVLLVRFHPNVMNPQCSTRRLISKPNVSLRRERAPVHRGLPPEKGRQPKISGA